MDSDIPRVTISKILMYISIMMSFRYLTNRKFERPTVYEKLSAVPSIIIDGLVSRFAETPRGSTELGFPIRKLGLSFTDTQSRPQSTSRTETLLLAHMFALCLRIDDYATDTTLLANDLSQKVATCVTFF